MRVADQGRVVAAGPGAVQGAADACVGGGAGDDYPAHAPLDEPLLEIGVLERVEPALCHERLVVAARGQLVGVLHAVLPRGMWSSRCWTQMTGTCSASASSTRVLMLASTRSRSWASPV